MKRTKMRKRSQVLLLIIGVMFLVSTMISVINPIISKDIKTRTQQEYDTVAFYLAQSAIEKAKVEILYGFWSAGTYFRPNPSAAEKTAAGCGACNCNDESCNSNCSVCWYYAPGYGKNRCGSAENLYAYWFCDMNWPDDLMFRYRFQVTNPGTQGANSRNLIGVGQVLGSYSNIMSQRKISVTIDGIADTGLNCQCLSQVKTCVSTCTAGTSCQCKDLCTITCASWNNGACASCACSTVGGGNPPNDCTCLSWKGCPVSSANGVDDDLLGIEVPYSWKEQ